MCLFCPPQNFRSRLIKTFEHSYWVLAENQFYQGYSLLLSKQHFIEWHDVPEEIALSLHQNLREIARLIQSTFQPHKINLASLGNVTPHLHWHIIPRYLSDPHHMQPPDFTMPASLTAEMLTFFKSKV